MPKLLLLFIFFPAFLFSAFSQTREPIIDVHLHCYDRWSSTNSDTSWYPSQFRRPSSTEDIMRQSLKALDQYNIVRAVTSGPLLNLQSYREATATRVIPGYELSEAPTKELIEQLRQRILAGNLKVFAELSVQYGGISPSDSVMDPFYQLAAQYDIPVGIHIGLGPSGAAYMGRYRSRLSSALVLEEALIRHPKVRFYVMHAGWPMLDDMIAMLYAFPNLHVDVGVINWYIPKEEFYTYLKRLIDAGFAKRIMYGSDQMEWPQAIGASIEAIESAPFLTKEQKRDIFYYNAVRFFKFSDLK